VERLAAIQRDLLAAALTLIHPDGRVIYSVCTVTREETIDQVDGLNAAAPDGIPGKVWGNGVLLAPHITGTDGMFISIVRRA
jgi:16S rRNA (cytosine967-C5)-methyltransferase